VRPSDHGWVHETTQNGTGRLDLMVVVLGAVVICGIIIHHFWKKEKP